MTEQQKVKTFDAWLNIDTGTIIPWSRDNERLKSKSNMKRIKATIDPETRQAVDVNSDQNITNVASSRSLVRIASTLRTLQTQRASLLAAGLREPNGADVLQRAGVYDPMVDDQLIDSVPEGEVKRAADKRDEDEELAKMKAKSAAKVQNSRKATANKAAIDSGNGGEIEL